MSLSLSQDLANRELLTKLLQERILVTDGATGTMLESLRPTADDFGGEEFFGCNEMLNSHGSWVPLAVHKAYLEAGADILETNSFNGSGIVLAEYGIEHRARELARRSAELANEAIKGWRATPPTPPSIEGGESPQRPKPIAQSPKFVLGSMGPGTRTITVTQNVTFDEVEEAYYQYAAGLLEGGADLLVLETQQDTLNVKAALLGIARAQRDLNRDAPVGLSVTIEASGTMLAGQTIEALYHTVSGFDLAFLGLNCATGPEKMSDYLRTLAAISRFPISVWPNAGLPDHDGHYSEGPDFFREVIGRFAREGWINIVGGCCGTTPDHIRAIREAVEGVSPRRHEGMKLAGTEARPTAPSTGHFPALAGDEAMDGVSPRRHEGMKLAGTEARPTAPSTGHFPALAGAEAMVVESDNRPVYIGERTNTIGSRKFKRLIGEGKWDEASEVGREQVRKGAMVLDVCTADPDREEMYDSTRLLATLLRKVRAPLMIDTTDAAVVEATLRMIGGKPAINSVNLEDGGARLRQVAGLAKRYGASLVCGLIDDDPLQGMAITVPRKLEIAEKIHRILTEEFGIPEADIIFDPLVFPAGTGDPNYLGAAESTIEGVRAVKERFPNCLTLLGISNVSFGLPPAGREVVNSVFLYLCAKAGLDMAIVNTEGLKRYPTIPPDEIALAERLLKTGSNEAIAEFTAHFRAAKVEQGADAWEGLSTEEKVAQAVVEARKTGLEDNLRELLARMTALEVINGPLMKGMDEVGRLFGDNRLIVAEVLESAEVMKAAVDFVKPFFPPGESGSVKGKLLLATVKGDVHDIGKNLVDMILSNNGYEVINLGIKVAPDKLIEAVAEHQPDIIGLSGLLVRSAQQMVATADDLTAAGISLPLLVGGAALTRKFTLLKIAPAYEGAVFYAGEAMEGLQLANQITDPDRAPALIDEWRSKREVLEAENDLTTKTRSIEESSSLRAFVVNNPPRWIETDVPEPPDLDEHIIEDISIDEVWPYINDQMLYGKHLGVKGFGKRAADPTDEKLAKLKAQVWDVVQEARREGILAPKAIYRWFKVRPEGERLVIIPPLAGRATPPTPPSIEEGENAVVSDLSLTPQDLSFSFPRQQAKEGICALDWVRPPERGGDHVALFVTTSGRETVTRAAEMRSEGRLLDSLILQSVAIELAEATAEWLHRRIRNEWGFGDSPDLTLQDVFHTKYRGIRLSFGYPACPSLEDQEPLFALLRPEVIGVELTEGMMMHPEGSVSAVVFHHPEGRYYSV